MIDKLLWFREDKDRPLTTDLAWAIKRHILRTGRWPNTIEVPPSRSNEFEQIDFTKEKLPQFSIKVDRSLGDKYFQLFYDPSNDEAIING